MVKVGRVPAESGTSGLDVASQATTSGRRAASITVACTSVPKVMRNSPPASPEPVVDLAFHQAVTCPGSVSAAKTRSGAAALVRVLV
jgi:hypothetical protein